MGLEVTGINLRILAIINAFSHVSAGGDMNNSGSSKAVLGAAWITVLVTMLFPIVLQEIFHYRVSEDLNFGFGGTIVLAGFFLTWVWRAIRPLRPFFGLFLVLIAAQWLILTRLDQVPLIERWLTHPSFNVYMPVELSLKLLVTLIIIAFMFLVKKDRRAFFLAIGDPAAPVEPVKWLGVKREERWNKFGWWLALFLSLGTLTFLLLAGRPSGDMVVRALPFLPVVLLAAALNAFNEEMTYKASFLAVLEGAVGQRQSLWLMAALFGLAHFYGIPYGIIGVLLATFLGWLLGKSMLETRGMLWAWFLHFLQDVLIFGFLAINAVTPGG